MVMGEFVCEETGGVGRLDPKRLEEVGRRGGKFAAEGEDVEV